MASNDFITHERHDNNTELTCRTLNQDSTIIQAYDRLIHENVCLYVNHHYLIIIQSSLSDFDHILRFIAHLGGYSSSIVYSL